MDFKALQNNFAQAGEVLYISVRPQRLAPLKILSEVRAVPNVGLEGDRYKNAGMRQVTLIQKEHLDAVASLLGKDNIEPALTRRNIVVKGINLIALKGKQFKIGNAVLVYSGECAPCSRMEESLGFGGYNAMRGHGGITAKVIQEGLIRIGDKITVLA